MKYINPQTKKKINLGLLTEEEKRFYQEAVKKFQENTEWSMFDEFVFGMKSPIYLKQSSHLDVLKKPLFLALKDMSNQLKARQRMLNTRVIKEKDIA